MSGLSRTFLFSLCLFLYLFNRDCLIRGIRRDCFINRILGEFLNQIVDGCDFVDLPRISTGKYQTMIDISADGTDQCMEMQ